LIHRSGYDKIIPTIKKIEEIVLIFYFISILFYVFDENNGDVHKNKLMKRPNDRSVIKHMINIGIKLYHFFIIIDFFS